jgi:hypothetical protein
MFGLLVICLLTCEWRRRLEVLWMLMIREAWNSVGIVDVSVDRSCLMPIFRDGAFDLVQQIHRRQTVSLYRDQALYQGGGEDLYRLFLIALSD